MRDDAGARLRTLRLRRGIPLAVLAGLSGVTPSFLSMVENGHRELRRWSDILALANALEASPLYLEFGSPDEPGPRAPSPMPFPAGPDAVTLGRHRRLAGEFAGLLAHGDGRACGDWLRRPARVPSVSPWLLIDQLASTASFRAPALFHAGVAGSRGGQPCALLPLKGQRYPSLRAGEVTAPPPPAAPAPRPPPPAQPRPRLTPPARCRHGRPQPTRRTAQALKIHTCGKQAPR